MSASYLGKLLGGDQERDAHLLAANSLSLDQAAMTLRMGEVLIHGNYMSQKDVEVCLGLNLAELRDRAEFPQMDGLHRSFVATYGDAGAAAR